MRNRISVLTLFLIIIFIFPVQSFCLDLSKAKIYLLKGDYTACIEECEKLLSSQDHSKDIPELYYITGIAYLKSGNYMRAGDIFEIILNEFKNSRFKQDALLGMGDSYFLMEEYDKAAEYYNRIIKERVRPDIASIVNSRLSQCKLKKDTVIKTYPDEANNQSVSSPQAFIKDESKDEKDQYTVQVGSFSKNLNASNLAAKLSKERFSAFIEEYKTDSGILYKVRVGKFNDKKGALIMQERLSQKGYPAKIFP